MTFHRVSLAMTLVLLAGSQVALGQSSPVEQLSNWAAPLMWHPPPVEVEEGYGPGLEGIRPIRVLTDLTGPLPFIAVAPCRVADTRDPNGPFGGPIFAVGEARTYALSTNPACPGFPAASTIQGYSLNITVTQTAGAGFVTGYPSGATRPVVSTVNFTTAGQSLSNAAIVPAGSGGNAGKVDIFASQQAHVIIDINGYYAGAVVTGVATSSNTANAVVRRDGSGNFSAGTLTLTGDLDLAGNLLKSGSRLLHTFGTDNLFVGLLAGNTTMTGVGSNTAVGAGAFSANATGDSNVAVGTVALALNTSGSKNTAVGQDALGHNLTGGSNTAVGQQALHLVTGSGNIGVGASAGFNIGSGSNNIEFGHLGVASESNTIRIGTLGTQTTFFAAGIRGATTLGDGLGVVIDSVGQLGTLASSAAVKRDISDVGDESSALLRLRPVSFFYRNDTREIRQYGLIAEEVAEVMPELVQFSASGEPETVRYHFLTPLLLNEVRKQREEMVRQNNTIRTQLLMIDGQREQIKALAARLEKVEEVVTPGATPGTITWERNRSPR